MHRCASFLAVACLLAGASHARTLYVSPSGSAVPPYDSWSNAAVTIAQGLSAATNGDRITVGTGIYAEAVDLGAMNVELVSTYALSQEWAIVENTVIDGGGTGICLRIAGGQGTQSLVQGFTLANGYAATNRGGRGGGLMVDHASPRLRDLVIRDCSAADVGGGANLNISRSPVENIVLRGNTASSGGGGIAMQGCTQTVSRLDVEQNWAGTAGGGAHIYLCTSTLRTSRIAFNLCGLSGGGVYQDAGRVLMENCTVAGNTCTQGAGIALGYVANLTLRNTILWSNAAHSIEFNPQWTGMAVAGERCLLAGGSNAIVRNGRGTVSWGTNNFSVNPRFLHVTYRDLQAVSPARDQGVFLPWMANALDLAGAPRLHGPAVDLGSYELPTDPPALYLSGVPESFTGACGDAWAPVAVVTTGGCGGVVEPIRAWFLDDQTGGAELTERVAGDTAYLQGAPLATAASSVPGRLGQAMSFNMTGHWARATMLSPLTGAVSRTVAFWMQTTARSGFLVAQGPDSGIARGFGASVTAAGLLNFWSGDGSNDLATTRFVADGQWHFVGLTYAATNLQVYIDGTLAASASRVLNTSTGTFHFACRPSGMDAQPCILDHVLVFDQALTAGEMAGLYGDGIGVEYLSGPLVGLSQSVTGTCTRQVTRVWTASDVCGSSVAATQRMTLVDTTGPVLIGVPADATVPCGAVLTWPPVTALDACRTQVTSVATSQVWAGGCPSVATRTWVATDACGNVSSATQTITLVEPPQLMLLGVPGSTNLICGEPLPAIAVTATGGCPAVAGAIRQWRMNDLSGTNIFVDSVAGEQARLYGPSNSAPSILSHSVTGVIGRAIRFESTNELGTAMGAFPTTGALPRTVTCWFRMTYTNAGCIFSIGAASSNAGFGLTVNATGRLCVWSGSAETVLTNYVRDAQWHFLALSYANSNLLASVDGQAPVLIVRGLNTAPGAFRFMCKPSGSERIGGELDNVVAYGRALDPLEIVALYAAGGGTEAVTGPAVSFDESVTGDCPRVIRRVWTATDPCGATACATQLVTTVDLAPPVLVGLPANAGVACGAWLPAPPAVTAYDACTGYSNSVAVTYEERGDVGCGGVVRRVWTAMDACGNSVSATQLLTVLAPTAPSLVGIPADVSVECDAIPPPAAPMALSDCFPDRYVGPVPYLSFSNSPFAAATFTDFRLETFEDGLLNVGGVSAVVGGVAGPGSSSDSVDGDDGAIDGLGREGRSWYTQNRTNVMTFVFTTNAAGAFPTHAGLAWTDGPTNGGGVFFEALDAQGRSLGVHGPFSLGDTGGLGETAEDRFLGAFWSNGISAIRLGMTASADWEMDHLQFGWSTAVAPPGPVTILRETVSTGCIGALTRVWTATDACGGSMAATQVITLVDTKPPLIEGTPSNYTAYCGQFLPLPDDLRAYDGCHGATLSLAETAAAGCPGVVTRVWTAVDGCGNASSVTQEISVVPAPPVQFVGIPSNVVVGCGEINPPAPLVTVTGGCLPSIDETARVLSFDFEQDDPTTVADGSGLGHHAERHGGAGVGEGAVGAAMYFDGASYLRVTNRASLNVTTLQMSVTGWLRREPTNAMAGHAGTIIEKCLGVGGNFGQYLVNFDDRGASRSALGFSPGRSASAFSHAIARGALTEGAWHHFAAIWTGSNIVFYVDGQRHADVVAYRLDATDIGANSHDLYVASCNPSNGADAFFTGGLDELSVWARAVTPDDIHALYDAGGSRPLWMQETTNGSCPEVVTRVWSVVDACGNTWSATQTITRMDTEPPFLVGVPADTAIVCGDLLPAPPDVSASDGCSSTLVLFAESARTGCPEVITRTWTAVDACGNSAVATQLIAILAAPALQLLGVPSNVAVECGSAPLPPAAPVAVGGCSSRGYLGPVPYLSFSNSPFASMSFSEFRLEDFEDGLLNVEGAAASLGGVSTPGDSCDSVDADDGTLDGLGRRGNSWYTQNLSNVVTFTFATNSAGAYPSHAGIVWTDGPTNGGGVFLEAFDGQGVSLGLHGPFALGDDDGWGGTSEDRFFGAVSSNGISAMRIGMTASVDWEMDHLQFGWADPVLQPAPVVVLTEYEMVGCPGIRTRVWTATDNCGDTCSATQVIQLVLHDGDGDGLAYSNEVRLGTNPDVADTDGDGCPDGREVARGSDPLSATNRPAAVRNDFDGEGESDLLVYQPAAAIWSAWRTNSTPATQIVQWGWAAVTPVLADFDGDAIVDHTAYHSPSGQWFIRQSATTSLLQMAWGWSAARPVAADYDGDGRADLAVYHPQGGNWYIRGSATSNLWLQSWGWAAALPVAGDFDGDGRADIAVYHPQSGNWYVRQSATSNLWLQSWGWSAAEPVPGDYDGDHRTDVAVYHAATGDWYVRLSSDGSLWRQNWGWSTALPVPADYDHDGKTDLAVYHRQAGTWYIRLSSDGSLRLRAWGAPAALPVLSP